MLSAEIESLKGRWTMKTTAKILRASGLDAALVLVFLTATGYGAHVTFGSSYGYSAGLTQVRYDAYDVDYTSRKLRSCVSTSAGIVFNGHVSLFAEAFTQQYNEVYHAMSNGGGAVSESSGTKFSYFGVSLEYRFFRDFRRPWNPYVDVGIYGLFYLDLFGSGPPAYPKTGSFKAAAGTRIRVAGPLFLTPQVAYFSGSSSVSFQVGLNLIL
jgi:hypothetical protein